MKIYDENLEHELSAPDLDAGHLVSGKRFVAHHEAVARAYHYEVMAETVTETRPEGLRCEVEDSPAQSAWDEYEDVQIYVPYSAEELAKMAAEKAAAEEKQAAEEQERKEAEAAAAEQARKDTERERRIARIDALDAQATYTAMMTDTLLEEET